MTAGVTPVLTWTTDAVTDDGDLQLRVTFTGGQLPCTVRVRGRPAEPGRGHRRRH
ncbi:hypothetical protein ACRAWF_30150 [Streptomyces sp. L7]